MNLYDNVYGDYGSAAEASVRRKTYGEDIGQSSWMTATELLRFADQLQVRPESHVLEVGSGSGGPAVHLATSTRCRVSGVDINEHGVSNGARLAAALGRGRSGGVSQSGRQSASALRGGDIRRRVLQRRDVPHRESSGSALGLAPRREAWREDSVHRRHGRDGAGVPRGRLRLVARSGFYLFVPPGENERLIDQAGFRLLGKEDLTEDAAAIAQRWHDAREQHRAELIEREGDANFAGLQRFLACVRLLSVEHRLSRYSYLAEKVA